MTGEMRYRLEMLLPPTRCHKSETTPTRTLIGNSNMGTTSASETCAWSFYNLFSVSYAFYSHYCPNKSKCRLQKHWEFWLVDFGEFPCILFHLVKAVQKQTFRYANTNDHE
ncbi:hypothetical protein SETIT_8G201900v2 [Setaria italica]|uniref:Uncharacterized protein n=1 Tax=Setaria italica TaxID=4555 RepID=A0A368SBF4_SETIT|nr:hypothetical protein SETIT_8G201900v2 [Setaria italica]